jgi:Trypsin-co-occurring domain 2
MTQSIGLADFINQVKHELMAQAPDGSSDARLLVVEDVEIEIQVGVTREGNAGLNLQVIQLGGGAKRDDTHTVKLRLQPLLGHDERVALLKADPKWTSYVAATMEHTIKGLGSDSQQGD